MTEVFQLLHRAHPGAHATVRAHIRRGDRVAAVIMERWQIHSVKQWRVKHVRWFLDVWCTRQGISEAARYDYWLTVRALAAALGRWKDWEGYLNGPWCRNGTGGRKPRLSSRATD